MWHNRKPLQLINTSFANFSPFYKGVEEKGKKWRIKERPWMNLLWNGPYPQWHHNIKMVVIVGGLCTEWYRERWRLAMITFIYCSKGEGGVYILTYKTNACSFVSIWKLRSGFAWLDYFRSHHANYPLIPSWFHVVKAVKKFQEVNFGYYGSMHDKVPLLTWPFC